MRVPILIAMVFLLACNTLTKPYASFWETQKWRFKYLNKREFVDDSILRAEYKNLNKSYHSLFRDWTSDPVYLYSWQERDSSKIEFTVVEDDGERGLRIVYFILDIKDSLLSQTQIAGRGSEGGYDFETRSRFISNDTLLHIGAITQWLDFDTKQAMSKSKGDSTFSYSVIDSNGKLSSKVFKEIKELNFRNE